MFESLLSTVPGTIGLGLWECLAGVGRRRHQAPSRAGAWAAWSISLVCKLGGGLPGTFRRWRALCSSDISLEDYPLVQFPRGPHSGYPFTPGHQAQGTLSLHLHHHPSAPNQDDFLGCWSPEWGRKSKQLLEDPLPSSWGVDSPVVVDRAQGIRTRGT